MIWYDMIWYDMIWYDIYVYYIYIHNYQNQTTYICLMLNSAIFPKVNLDVFFSKPVLQETLVALGIEDGSHLMADWKKSGRFDHPRTVFYHETRWISPRKIWQNANFLSTVALHPKLGIPFFFLLFHPVLRVRVQWTTWTKWRNKW